MKLSEFFAQLQKAGDLSAFTAYLAEPDADGQDVDLASVGRVEVDEEKAEVRIFPASTSTDVDSVEPEPYLGMILDELPREVFTENDMRLLVECPILRDAGAGPVRFVELSAISVGTSSEEIWLLVRPASDFADGLLPT